MAARSPRLPARLLTPLILAIPLAFGCAEDQVQPGEPGGPCRVGSEACVEGYSCVGGTCGVVDAEVGTASYSAVITVPDAPAPADGETGVDFDFLITTAPVDGDPRPYDPETDGQIFITVSPPEAGRIEPASPVLVQGLGIASFIPCHRGEDPACPAGAVIRITREDAPLEPIGESMRIVLTEPDQGAPADMGIDGGM